MKKYKNKFKSFIMLYGWKFALLKVFKAVIYRITSFRWEKNYLMTRVLDEEIELHIGDDMLIREIVIDDYNKCWKDDYVDNNRLNKSLLVVEYYENAAWDNSLYGSAIFDDGSLYKWNYREGTDGSRVNLSGEITNNLQTTEERIKAFEDLMKQ